MSSAPVETASSPIDLFRDPEFVAIASVKFVSGMAFATIIIALALYADIFEASGLVAGLFGSVYAGVRLFIVLPLGRRIDIGNSKTFLLIGLGLNILMLVGFMLVQSIEHVIALRGLQAFGTAILGITGVTVIGELAPEIRRGLWIGTYSQVSAVSSLAGDLIGGALLFVYGFGPTYTVLVGVSILSTAAVFRYVRDDPGTRADPDEATGVETFIKLLKRRVILALIGFRLTFSFAKVAVFIFLPIYARVEFGMSALLIGGILAGGKLTMGITQGRIGELADRIGGLKWFIFAGAITYGIGTALIPMAGYASQVFSSVTIEGLGYDITLVPAFFLLFLTYVVLGIADSLRLPPSMSLFTEEGEYFDAVAGSFSLRSISWQVGAIAGPLVVGAAFDYLSFLEGFWIAAIFPIIAGVVFIGLYESESPPGLPDAAKVDR